jgi:hypothetical protein
MLRAAASLAALAAAAGHQSYVALNPNGAGVTIPRGVAAIGHVDVNGGGAVNQYGADFSTQGGRWTRALCEADSDGDGQTNGLELGDPCCIWKVGGKAPNTTHAISNPGDKAHKTTRKCTEYNCTIHKVDPCKPKLLAAAPSLRGAE